MAYSHRQSHSQSISASSTSGGFAGGAGGYGQGDGAYGHGAGGYGHGAGGYGQCGVGGFGGGNFVQGAGGFGQYGGGFGQGGGAFGQNAGGFGQGAGFGGGYGGGAGFGGGFGGADGGAGFGGGDNIFSGNEKQTMQNLNERLASYLEKVQTLEAENNKLEQQMKEFYEKQRSGSTTGEGAKDYSKFYAIIEELKPKIVTASNENGATLLQIDNARLAAEDFRLKYDNESILRRSVEADINGLNQVKNELDMVKSDLESTLQSLIEELTALKANREEEVKGSQGTTIGDVNVEMNAAPGTDLLKKLNEMRQEYETMAEKNRQDAENQFKKMSEGLKKEISAGVAEEKSSKSEVSDLRKSLQTLEIECQSLLALKRSLEESLAQTEGQFCLKLSGIQAQIGAIEEQLEQIRAEIECQTAEYEHLMDAKVKLESEIGKYRELLDGSGTGQSGQGSGSTSGAGTGTGTGTGSTSSQETKRTKRVKQLEEIIQDGKVISQKVVEKEVPI